MASWLECSTPDRVVRVQVLAGDCVAFLGKTLTVPLSTQVRRIAGGNPVMD